MDKEVDYLKRADQENRKYKKKNMLKLALGDPSI